MYRNLMRMLVCPNCKSDLGLSVDKEARGQVEIGMLRCRNLECEGRYPIEGGIPRFVANDRYVGSFSKQRSYMRRHFGSWTDNRLSFEQFWPTSGFSEKDIEGKRFLDAGCGIGRFTDVVDTLGAKEIVSVDMSTEAIELAREYLGDRARVHLVQADLCKLPFRDNNFDRIFSIGVLHHTPDTRRSFNALIPLLKCGGKIAIWVYPPEMKRTSDMWRTVTTRLPHPILYGWCISNQALFSFVRALPGGWRFSKIVPGAIPKRGVGFWVRVMSDFDDLSPKYAHSHTPEEVVSWFRDAGLTEIESLPRRSAVIGKIPI